MQERMQKAWQSKIEYYIEYMEERQFTNNEKKVIVLA